MDEPTFQAMATVVGGGIVAGLLVQFVKIFAGDLTDKTYRMLAAGFGLITVVGATVVLSGFDWRTFGLSIVVGVQAGLSASQTYQVVRDGLNFDTVR